MSNYTITYILKNDMGGIASVIQNLIEYRNSEALPQHVIFLKIDRNIHEPYQGSFVKNVPITFFDFTKDNNFYYSFKKLKSDIGDNNGVLISNDIYDLIMATYYNIPKKIIQIVHDAYNVKLSLQFESVIDQFICHSFYYYEMLNQLLPDRRRDIHFINFGIPIIPKDIKKVNNSQLHLVFSGRHSKTKGVYDLFEINNILKENNVLARWLILGKGPETNGLKKQWCAESNVKFCYAESSMDIIKLCMKQDILVFPTKFEGFPVAMIEAMSVGCVPIVSDLPGGIREVGNKGNAIICELDNNRAFAESIIKLNNNRSILKQMSDNCIEYVSNNHNAVLQSEKYQRFFKKIALSQDQPRHHKIKRKLGSRLDHPLIPNIVTKLIRKNFRSDN